MDKEYIRHKLKHNTDRLISVIKWVVFSLVSGLVLGVIGAVFSRCISAATQLRIVHKEILLLLPVGAVCILWLYHILHDEKDGGTNLVIDAIHSDDNIPLRMAPLIFVSTVLSHFVGASVGREGAALQLGGSIGNNIGKLFRFSDTDRKTMIMVGMTGVFSALFGTPLAATVFSMEVVSVGIMHYAALMPCVLCSFTARGVAAYLGAKAPFYKIGELPPFSAGNACKVVILACLCGVLSAFFCVCLHKGSALSKKYLKNQYLRAMILGALILILTVLVGDQTYNGAGGDYILSCLVGDEKPLGFLVKILFTTLSIAAGYKGGEIVPSFFIGASFGSLYGGIMNFSPGLSAAIGMGAVFCGVTNCPISSFLICCELFGFSGSPYFLTACAFSYVVSGYHGLYTGQTIVYSKYRSNYINKHTH